MIAGLTRSRRPGIRRLSDSHESVHELALTKVSDEAFTMCAEPNPAPMRESRKVCPFRPKGDLSVLEIDLRFVAIRYELNLAVALIGEGWITAETAILKRHSAFD